VALMDRGLPSNRLIDALVDQGLNAVVPMASGGFEWPETGAFLELCEVETVLPVNVRDPDGAFTTSRSASSGSPPHASGSSKDKPRTASHRSSLLDPATHSVKAILRRNGGRWGVENAYCKMKIAFAIKHFQSEDADSIVNESYA
jgi:hypothetical protein